MPLRLLVLASSAVLVCACPAVVPPGPLTKGYEVEEHADAFPIDEGSMHALNKETFAGALTCASCHDGGETFSTFFCLRCHEVNPTRDLTLAHRLYGEATVWREDTACLTCHPTGIRATFQPPIPDDDPDDPDEPDEPDDPDEPDEPEPFVHVYFPVDPGDLHHGESNETYRAREDAFGVRGCAACHIDGNDYTITVCADCHQLDAAPSLTEAHATDTVTTTSYTAVGECKSCHSVLPVPVKMKATPAPGHHATYFQAFSQPWPHRTDATLCADCHTQAAPSPYDFATNFGSFECNTKPSCNVCHAAGCP